MDNILVPERIHQIFAVFYKLGLWRSEEENAFREVTRKLLYLMLHVFFLLSLILGAYTTENNDECIFLVVVTISVVTLSVRLAYILWRKKEICAFIQEIGVHVIEDRETFMKIDKKSKMFLKFVTGFLIITFTTVVILIVSPLPGVSNVKRLPLNVGFPLDWQNSEIGYWIAFVYLACECMLSFVCVFITPLIWYMMLHCSTKHEVLGSQFQNIGQITSMKILVQKRKISVAEKQNLFLEELIGLIKKHQNIKETTARFRSCFAKLFLIQIATSAMSICGSIHALAFNLDASLFQYGIYTGVLVYFFFDILMVMYLGNEIKLSSNRLSNCLFESNWTEQSQSCKKCIIILMEVLKQPEELVICKLYPLNLETFTLILNGAYSMLNILQNIK